MDFEAIKAWYARWTGKEANSCRLKGILGLVLMPVALAVALTLVYWLLRLFTHDAAHNLGDPVKCLWITLAVLPCMFVGNKLMPRRNLMEERMSEGVNPMYAHSAANRGVVLGHLFLWILFTGPRLLDWALSSFREAALWKKADIHSCSAVLWILVTRSRKTSYEDILRELEWLDLETVLPEMKRIPGVLFLQAPPPGLSLTQELRDSIRSDLG